MRIILAALALFFALFTTNSAYAESDDLKLDLGQICIPGCVVTLVPPKFESGIYVGRFHPVVNANKLLDDTTGFERLNVAITLFQLVDEPGAPMFMSLQSVKEYMEAHDTLVGETDQSEGTS